MRISDWSSDVCSSDLGPKLRVGTFKGGPAELVKGKRFVLDSDPASGDATRVHLPHPELFAALEAETRLLIDDGKLVLRVKAVAPGRIETLVEVGGAISARKGEIGRASCRDRVCQYV